MLISHYHFVIRPIHPQVYSLLVILTKPRLQHSFTFLYLMTDNRPSFHPLRDESLAVRYVHRSIPNKHLSLNNQSFRGPITKLLPMISLFLRNKVIAWASLVIYWYLFLQESNSESGDGALIDLLSCSVGLLACYIDIIMPLETHFA
ncbi:hypothetical protein ACO0OE_000535 [Hanseniaspora uvarum]|nr:hypothetical protein DAHU10_021420 [Hanseniaspora uvarum]